MNAPETPGLMSEEEVLRMELEFLRREHRDLDQAIEALQARPGACAFTLRRLKARRLRLRDRIRVIEDRLTPDIIA